MSAAEPEGTTLSGLRTAPGEIEFEVGIGGRSYPVWVRSSLDSTPAVDVAVPIAFGVAMTEPGPLRVEAPVDETLLRRLPEIAEIFATFRHRGRWQPAVPLINRPQVIAEPAPAERRRADRGVAAFFSLGVDAFATLHRNPQVTHLIYVAGLDVPVDARYQPHHQRLRAGVAEVAEQLGLETIWIETNVRELFYGRGLSGAAWFGFATGGLSRLVASEARTVLLASSQAHRVQLPNSSHPMIDHLWGSDQLQVVHEGGELARTEKVELIAANPIARERLRVCWQSHDGDVNCGRCEKCLRTMVALEAIGALGDFPTFPDDLDLDRVAAVRPAVRHEVAFWRENLALAREHGARADLCEAIESAIDGALPIRPSRPPAKPVGPASRVIAAEDAGLRPRAAIVIPVFRQPQFVANAIRSALESRTEFEVAVVVVNDGCPYPSTEANSLRAREIDPGRTAYLAQENAGLAAARNAGVAYALETWPAAEAIFFLDADNEFGPDAIAALWRVLEDDPAASWAYAYREMFGAEGGGWEVPGGFNSYRQLFENQCDAGSLVRREVFTEHEVMFDASMRTGYRDWEFFIRAMRRGLRGVPAGRCGFRYRRRAFSMVERSMREHESLLEQIRADPDAYSPRALARREHEALPRFALVDPSLGSVELTASVEPAGLEHA